MRVAFDETIFAVQRAGGISRYFVEVAKVLTQYADLELRVVAPLYINEFLRVAAVPKLGIHYGRFLHQAPRGIGLINRTIARPILEAIKPDVVHETYYRRDSGAVRGCPTIVTVYDMIHERFPSCFADGEKLSRLKRAAVERADRVVCISQQTRTDLIELFNVPETKIAVTYLASSMIRGLQQDEAVTSESNYLLYVGTRGGYKNFEAVLEVLPQLRQKHDVRLVAFGGGRLTHMELQQMSELELNECDVEHRDGDDDELQRLYCNALALVYPSLYEGFGIPPLEAMGLGCPVVCSSCGSLPEVVGDAAEIFSPLESGSLLASIVRVIEDNSRRRELRLAGLQQAKLFSWRRCAEETAAVYRSVLAT
jgi:glycosyltransferase involved in cell wall biosynthesis